MSTHNWFGLGATLGAEASLEDWSREGGFDFRFQRSPVQYLTTVDKMSITETFPNKEVVFRNDNQFPIGIVSPQFKIVQPIEALEFFRDLIGSAGMVMETAGVLFGGKRFWAMANTGNWGKINEKDEIKGNLLFVTGADGLCATSASLIAVRTKNNTTIPLRNKINRASISHKSVYEATVLKEKLGVVKSTWGNFMTEILALDAAEVSEEHAEKIVYRLSKKPDVAADDQPNSVATTVDGIMQKFTDISLGKKSAWDLMGAITEYHDLETGKSRQMDRVLWNSFFGDRAAKKQQAFDTLTKIYGGV